MALNLDKLTRRNEFDFESDSLGRLHLRGLTLNMLSELERFLEDKTKTPTGRVFVVKLVELVAEHIDEEDKGEDHHKQERTPVTAADAEQLKNSEIEAIARDFLAHNRHLLETFQGADKEVQTNDKGEKVASITPRQIDLPKKEGEKDSEYLLRVMRHYLNEQRRRFSEITKPLFTHLGSLGDPLKSVRDTLRENLFLSDRLGALASISEPAFGPANIGKPDLTPALEMPSIPELPENPVYETNQRLSDVLDYIDKIRPLIFDSANLIRSLNDASIRMLTDYSRNARRTELYSLGMIFIAALSLVVTAVFSIMNYTSRNDSAARTEQLVEEFSTQVQSLSDAQGDRTDRLIVELQQLLAKQSFENREALREVLTNAIEGTNADASQADDQTSGN